MTLSFTLLAISVLASGALAGAPAYCANAPVWVNGKWTQSTGKDWSSYGGTSWFRAGICLQISGIHVTQTAVKTLLVIDRSDFSNSFATLPNGKPAFAEEVNLQTGAQRPLDVKTNAFCSTGQYLPDGSLLNIGGDHGPGSDGGFSLRKFTPCTNRKCDFQVIGQMTGRRWYPTAQLLPDGRVLIVGGAVDGADINNLGRNNPSVEYWPRQNGEKIHWLRFLKQTLPYNLYPFVHLLPSGVVFIFAQNSYTLFDTKTSKSVPGRYPSLRHQDQSGAPIYRSYPVAGTSALLPLSSSNKYKAEVIVCGGNSNRAKVVPGNPAVSALNGYVPADSWCWRIRPEDPKPQWFGKNMGQGRVMGNAVLLPDNSVLIINGAQQGHSGIPNYAHQPNVKPVIYSPKQKRFYKNLPASKVPRLYHASALLLHDGRVFLSGSNPSSGTRLGSFEFPTEFRTEYFYPPYFTHGKSPQLLNAPTGISIGSQFKVTFKAFQPGFTPFKNRFEFTLAHAGFSTHGANHGMRNVVLDVVAISSAGNLFTATLKAPPSKNICPPTFYWLFVTDFGVPNQDGYAVYVK